MRASMRHGYGIAIGCWWYHVLNTLLSVFLLSAIGLACTRHIEQAILTLSLGLLVTRGVRWLVLRGDG